MLEPQELFQFYRAIKSLNRACASGEGRKLAISSGVIWPARHHKAYGNRTIDVTEGGEANRVVAEVAPIVVNCAAVRREIRLSCST